MGQKVSPNGLRIGINKDWQSKWYANSNDVPKYLMNDVEIRKYLFSKYKDAGIASIVIERNKKRTEVFIHASKPGIIIGQMVKKSKKLRRKLKNLLVKKFKLLLLKLRTQI